MDSQTLPSITKAQYSALDAVFDALNKEFFTPLLPSVVFTLDYSKAKSVAYYHAKRLEYKKNGENLDVIAFNPDLFSRTDVQIASTMLHEMCHEWESLSGKASRTAYHSSAWADKMKSFGLTPLFMNKARTSVTHTVDDSGKFALFIKAHPFDIALLKGREESETGTAVKSKERNKVKYTCPSCGANVWGKPALRVMCAECSVLFVRKD